MIAFGHFIEINMARRVHINVLAKEECSDIKMFWVIGTAELMEHFADILGRRKSLHHLDG